MGSEAWVKGLGLCRWHFHTLAYASRQTRTPWLIYIYYLSYTELRYFYRDLSRHLWHSLRVNFQFFCSHNIFMVKKIHHFEICVILLSISALLLLLLCVFRCSGHCQLCVCDDVGKSILFCFVIKKKKWCHYSKRIVYYRINFLIILLLLIETWRLQ